MSLILSRRDWIKRLSLAGMGAALAPGLLRPSAQSAGGKDHKTYFGDLQNHNVIGYAQGLLERTFETARNHLDFFAFTPHGHWHDIGTYENQKDAPGRGLLQLRFNALGQLLGRTRDAQKDAAVRIEAGEIVEVHPF